MRGILRQMRARVEMGLLVASLGSGVGCSLVGGYDFEGYRFSSTSDSRDASDGRDASSPDAPHCIPITCEELGAECGRVPDGCSDVLECGSCRTGVCGGGGRNKCGDDPCSPRT